eukprot:7224841-Prymnesium_polylepis.1
MGVRAQRLHHDVHAELAPVRPSTRRDGARAPRRREHGERALHRPALTLEGGADVVDHGQRAAAAHGRNPRLPLSATGGAQPRAAARPKTRAFA